jgi:hypothetical protein
MEYLRQQSVDFTPTAQGQYAGIHDVDRDGLRKTTLQNDDFFRSFLILLY